jgi:hypothetical protein
MSIPVGLDLKSKIGIPAKKIVELPGKPDVGYSPCGTSINQLRPDSGQVVSGLLKSFGEFR